MSTTSSRQVPQVHVVLLAELDKCCGAKIASQIVSHNDPTSKSHTLIEYDISQVVYCECWYAIVKIGGARRLQS